MKSQWCVFSKAQRPSGVFCIPGRSVVNFSSHISIDWFYREQKTASPCIFPFFHRGRSCKFWIWKWWCSICWRFATTKTQLVRCGLSHNSHNSLGCENGVYTQIASEHIWNMENMRTINHWIHRTFIGIGRLFSDIWMTWMAYQFGSSTDHGISAEIWSTPKFDAWDWIENITFTGKLGYAMFWAKSYCWL